MSEKPSLFHISRPSSLPDNAPALIMLHGYGSDENDLFAFASELPDELFIISVRAPLQLMPYGYAWYSIHFDAPQGKWNDMEQALAARDALSDFIDEAVEKYPIDPTRVSLLGFSQGTILSYAVALNYPEKVKNVVALSGYIFEEIMPSNPENRRFDHLDFYCSHGSADQVIPVTWARHISTYLTKLQIRHEYHEFPVGHGVAPQNFYEFRDWLIARL